MKYYGIKKQLFHEDLLFYYAKKRAKILSLLPGKNNEFWKRNYKDIYENKFHLGIDYNNAIPDNNTFQLYSLVISDLIRREDIVSLKRGLKKLLKKRKSNRFLNFSHEGLDELCKKIEQMDASLLSWYNKTEFGIFEFNNHALGKNIDYFSVSICNLNSGYLSIIFDIHLTDEKQEELQQLIKSDFKDFRGYASRTMTVKSNKTGAFENFTITNYNDDFLKADKIYEFLSCIEWDFLQELSKDFPFVLHNKSIMPPRIEIYSTSIDYHDDNRSFWNSIGISEYQGQFLSEEQKIFFENHLSDRYDMSRNYNRLIYIFRDDGIEIGQLKSIKDYIHHIIRENANDFFIFMFLDILAHETGKTLISYKHKLDKIKLKKNHLNSLLKLKYKLSLETDDYSRYKRDDIWSKARKRIDKEFEYCDCVAKMSKASFFISHSNFCESTISESTKLDTDIAIVNSEFEQKKVILQNISEYNNAAKSIVLNIFTVLLTALTLFFVVFPDKANDFAMIVSKLWELFLHLFK